MGQLRTSLTAAATLVRGIQKAAEDTTKRLMTVSSDADAWMGSAKSAVSEFSLYMQERLKAKNLALAAVENDPISRHGDRNVANYFQAIRELSQLAVAHANRWNDTDVNVLTGDIKRFQGVLDEIDGQIAKKKKKLLQSKKYQAKIALYERALGEVRLKVRDLRVSISSLKTHKPLSAARIHEAFAITPDSPVKDLVRKLPGKFRELYAEFNKAQSEVGKSVNQVRKESEFAGQLKVLQEMIAEAEEMDKAAV